MAGIKQEQRMPTVEGIYKFQFNHDSYSRLALSQLLQAGWRVWDMGDEDGYSWVLLASPKALERND